MVISNHYSIETCIALQAAVRERRRGVGEAALPGRLQPGGHRGSRCRHGRGARRRSHRRRDPPSGRVGMIQDSFFESSIDSKSTFCMEFQLAALVLDSFSQLEI